jgi:hypothetical protein
MGKPNIMKQIAIDTVFLNNRYSGISIVWYDILSNLIPEGYEIVIFKRQNTYLPPNIKDKYKVVPINSFSYGSSDIDYINSLCKKYNIDYFISTYYTCSTTVPCIVYIHDMIPEIFNYNFTNPMWKQKRECLKNGKFFICVSNNSMSDFKKYYPNKEQVYLNYNSLNTEKFKIKDASILSNISKPFFMMLASNSDPYKNIKLVKDMFTNHPDLFKELDFIFLTHKFMNIPAKWVKNITDSQLSALYENALGIIYPSLYEGFGIPILEGFYHNTNVLTCKNSSLKEIGEDACVYIDEKDSEDLYVKIKEVKNKKYKNLLPKGYEISQKYSVKKQVDNFNKIINQII